LSGFMFPFEAMPLAARIPALALPLTHFNRLVRGIMLKGSNFSDRVDQLVAMTIILVVLVVVSSLRFRKKLI